MTTAVQQYKTPVAALAAMCDYADPILFAQALKATVFPNGQATNEQLMAFCTVAKTYGLNPFLKQLYAFPSKGGGVVPMVSVDGWAHIITKNPQMDGMRFDDHRDDKGDIFATTCTIKRKDWSEPCVVTEYMDECRGTSGPWQKSPKRMLRHRAMIQCARIAFGLGGIHDEDDAETIADAEPPRVVVEQKPRSLAALANKIAPRQPEPVPTDAESAGALTPEQNAEMDRQIAAEQGEDAAEFFAAPAKSRKGREQEH